MKEINHIKKAGRKKKIVEGAKHSLNDRFENKKYGSQNRKSQIWSMDFFSGLVIFIVVILISVRILFSMTTPDSYELLYRDSIHLSSSLLGPGYPIQWNRSTVIVPGLIFFNGTNRIDPGKLIEFDSIDYERSKSLLHLSNEYIFFFRNSTSVINISRCVRGYPIYTNGKCEPDLGSIKYSDLVKIERIVIYNSSLVTMTIYMWH